MEISLSVAIPVFLATIFFLIIGIFINKLVVARGMRMGRTLADIKDEMEIRKSIYTVLGAVTVVATVILGVNEFRLKGRAEDRQLLYASLGQLAGNEVRPDIATAALLQLGRLADYSENERSTIIQILSAYLNESAKYPVSYYDSNASARPDIQIGLQIISDLVSKEESLGRLVSLRGIDLRYIQLDEANLKGVRILNSHFNKSDIINSNFEGCDITRSRLVEASFSGTIFDNCTMSFADFSHTNLGGASFCGNVTSTNAIFLQAKNIKEAKCLPEK